MTYGGHNELLTLPPGRTEHAIVQYTRHASDKFPTVSVSMPPQDATLILLRTDDPFDEELVEQARAALCLSSPGAGLFNIGTPPASHNPKNHQQRYIPSQLLHSRKFRSRLFTFPPHEAFGNISLKLLAQGVPAEAMNLAPLPKRRHTIIDETTLLLILPNNMNTHIGSTSIH